MSTDFSECSICDPRDAKKRKKLNFKPALGMHLIKYLCYVHKQQNNLKNTQAADSCTLEISLGSFFKAQTRQIEI